MGKFCSTHHGYLAFFARFSPTMGFPFIWTGRLPSEDEATDERPCLRLLPIPATGFPLDLDGEGCASRKKPRRVLGPCPHAGDGIRGMESISIPSGGDGEGLAAGTSLLSLPLSTSRSRGSAAIAARRADNGEGGRASWGVGRECDYASVREIAAGVEGSGGQGKWESGDWGGH
jgi:hypothetical protein